MIAEAAYYRAQKPEFAGESALEHWLAAEEEIRLFLADLSTGAVSLPAPPKRVPAPESSLPMTEGVAEGSVANAAAIKRQGRKRGTDVEKKGAQIRPL